VDLEMHKKKWRTGVHTKIWGYMEQTCGVCVILIHCVYVKY